MIQAHTELVPQHIDLRVTEPDIYTYSIIAFGHVPLVSNKDERYPVRLIRTVPGDVLVQSRYWIGVQ